jgi:YgiT-type zinc finger domain-containing protein
MKKLNLKKKKITCPLCQGTTFRKRTTTYPMRMLDGRQVNVERVPVHECKGCDHLVPTPAGADKINRCMMTMTALDFFKI